MPSSSCPMAAISAPAATFTTSSGHWSAWTREACSYSARMTGDLVKAMLGCGKPIVTAVDGGGAPAPHHHHGVHDIVSPHRGQDRVPVRASASPALRHGGVRSPRIVGQGVRRLLSTGRTMPTPKAKRWGLTIAWSMPPPWKPTALDMARRIVAGPTFAHGIARNPVESRMVRKGLDRPSKPPRPRQSAQTRDFEARLPRPSSPETRCSRA